MFGYATGTANETEEEEEEENAEGNRKQPAMNPIGGSRAWEKKVRQGHARKGQGTWTSMQRL